MYFSNNGWQIIDITNYLNIFLHVTLSLDVDGIQTAHAFNVFTYCCAVRLCRDSRPPRDK